jgi:fermentation-respiration switch protein FrsA (DUF1100 family)
VALALAGLAAAVAANSDAPATVDGGAQAATAEQDGTRDPSPVLNVAARVVAAAFVCGLMLIAAVLFFEDRFVFHPSSAGEEPELPAGLRVTECRFPARDGTPLHGWWCTGSAGKESGRGPVLLWCHGNAGNVYDRTENLRLLAQRGFDVFIFDYRGYGHSEGKPSEVGLYLDVEGAHEYLVRSLGVAPERIICFGRSLGASVACHCALRRRVAGLILEGAFESVPAMVRHKLLALASVLLKNRFSSISRVPRLRVPLLVIHGARDRIVSVDQGRAVFEAAAEPKEFHLIPDAGHNDTYEAGGRAYFDLLWDFCKRCAAGGS